MSTWALGRRPISIAILAMGGEGGGVLADWIVDLGENSGYVTQSTSVAGVAQRTGATIYYVEMFPRDDKADSTSVRKEPVLSLFPTPGQVDIVIASELMEAGRALQRGFCTPDRTTMIASTNRVYAISEKIALGDGRVDNESLIGSARSGAKKLVAADFNALAQQAGSVISSSLFGALAGSGALPIPRESFEEALIRSGKAVEKSLAAFGLGFETAMQAAEDEALAAAQDAAKPAGLGPVKVTIGMRPPTDPVADAAEAEEKRHNELAISNPHALVGPKLQKHMDSIPEFPEAARSMIVRGCVRTAVYQSTSYTDRFLDRVARVAPLEKNSPNDKAMLTHEVARHAALWMTYQDTSHVALQKLRKNRMKGVRDEAKPGGGELTQVREFLHPQAAEITDALPSALGKALAKSKGFTKLVNKLTQDGMIVNTTSVFGYSALWFMAAMRPIRPKSYRYEREQIAIDAWLDTIVEIGAEDYDFATQIARAEKVLKGYGETHAHGSESFKALMEQVPRLRGRSDAATMFASLTAAALADEDGTTLRRSIAALPVGASV